MNIAVLAVAEGDELPNGFPLWLARQLRRSGEYCTLIWAKREYRWGVMRPLLPEVELLYLARSPSRIPRNPARPLFELSRVLAPVLRRFDIVYSLLSGHPAMHALRERRFGPAASPYVVTVVTSVPDEVSATAKSDAQTIADERFGERYQVRHSDFLAYLDPVQSQQLHSLGWKLPAPERVRLANRDAHTWSTIHREIVAAANAAVASGRSRLPSRTTPPVTVCVCVAGDRHRSEVIFDSLLQQTAAGFTVSTVTSASDSNLSPHTRERARERGWRLQKADFNSSAEALNIAARHAETDYLLFLYDDDIALPRIVERMLEAAAYSGDDALGSWSWRFPAGSKVYDFEGKRLVCNPTQLHTPTGNDLNGDLLEDSSAGSVSLVRRAAFEAVGGFPTNTLAGKEGSALRARLIRSGFSTDLVPEFLRYHQMLSREAVPHVSSAGAIASPPQPDAPSSARSAMVFRGVEPEDRAPEAEEAVPIAKRVPVFRRLVRPEQLRLLLVVAGWPYPATSGYLQRCLALIRFLGTRHALTLVSFLSPFEEPTRHELLPYCDSIYAVHYGGPSVPEAEGLPRLVRERQTMRMRDTIRSIPTHLYQAALLEQIFLAPYREVIDAPSLLNEHHVESALMAQASQQEPYAQFTSAFANPAEEAEALHAYEDRTWPQFEVRTAVSEPDRRTIQERAGGRGRTILVENGTDPSTRFPDARPDTGTALFVGTLGYYPNVDAVLYFIKEIWPQILQRDAALRLICAGNSATPSVRAIKKERRVELIENPPDLRSIAARASVSIIPLRIGSGTRIKILESMAFGLPVVSTSRGCEGLRVEDGEHLLIRDTPEDFAEAVVEVLKDKQLWNRLRTNAFELIERHYQWDRVLEPLNAVLWNLASR